MDFYRLVKEHGLYIGILADILTFSGALLLGRDAFRHLKELQEKSIHQEFWIQNPDLPLDDFETRSAATAVKMAIRGVLMLLVGFLLQILARIADS